MVSLQVLENPATQNLIDAAQLAHREPGAAVTNASCGTVVDI